MTGTQSIGLLALGIGALAYMKQRGMCVLCRQGEETSSISTLNLLPEPPSNLGTWFDMLIAEVVGDKRAGNAPDVPATSSSRPIGVAPIPNWQPSVDEWMPPNPVNPNLAAGHDDAPEFDAFVDGGSFFLYAWTMPPGSALAGDHDSSDHYSPGA